jgi:hypothetical protein
MDIALGKTIQIYLPDGNPRSIKVAEITSRTIQALLIPRSKLDFAYSRSELSNVGIYFLIGNPDDEIKPLLYVGETEDCAVRLKQHNKAKDFWNIAIVVISKTKYFTKTHIKFLEWYCHEEARQAGRFRIENNTVPSRPYTPEPIQADLRDNFETIRILTSTLGYPIFDPIIKAKKKNVLVCKGVGIHAEGEYIEDGFVVFADSSAKIKETNTIGKWTSNLRNKLVEEGILSEEGNVYRFTQDHIFSSPSSAAATVLGRSANGWELWKYQDGKTLSDVIRLDETE